MFQSKLLFYNVKKCNLQLWKDWHIRAFDLEEQQYKKTSHFAECKTS